MDIEVNVKVFCLDLQALCLVLLCRTARKSKELKLSLRKLIDRATVELESFHQTTCRDRTTAELTILQEREKHWRNLKSWTESMVEALGFNWLETELGEQKSES